MDGIARARTTTLRYVPLSAVARPRARIRLPVHRYVRERYSRVHTKYRLCPPLRRRRTHDLNVPRGSLSLSRFFLLPLISPRASLALPPSRFTWRSLRRTQSSFRFSPSPPHPLRCALFQSLVVARCTTRGNTPFSLSLLHKRSSARSRKDRKSNARSNAARTPYRVHRAFIAYIQNGMFPRRVKKKGVERGREGEEQRGPEIFRREDITRVIYQILAAG